MEPFEPSHDLVLQADSVGGKEFDLRAVRLDALPESQRLRVNVVFTTRRATGSALGYAKDLSAGLDAALAVIVPQTVPFALALDPPPVSLASTCQCLCELAASVGARPRLYICLCRDPLEALWRMLPLGALAVFGVPKHPWTFRHERLARALRRGGREVIQVPCT